MICPKPLLPHSILVLALLNPGICVLDLGVSDVSQCCVSISPCMSVPYCRLLFPRSFAAPLLLNIAKLHDAPLWMMLLPTRPSGIFY